MLENGVVDQEHAGGQSKRTAVQVALGQPGPDPATWSGIRTRLARRQALPELPALARFGPGPSSTTTLAGALNGRAAGGGGCRPCHMAKLWTLRHQGLTLQATANMPPVRSSRPSWLDLMTFGFKWEAASEEDRHHARDTNQQRHDSAEVRRDDRRRRRGARGSTVPWRQGAGLRAGSQGALSAVDQLRSRRRRRDRPAGPRVHEGHRHRDDGREDQPERHGGADHRRDRERQRRRRDPDERQPAAAVRQWPGRPQRADRRGGR